MKRIGGKMMTFIGAVFLWLFFCFSTAHAQQKHFSVQLKSFKFPFDAEEFFVNRTFDIRDDKSSIGLLIVPGSPSGTSTQTVDFNGKADEDLARFINKGLERKTGLRPVNISLKRLRVSETTKAAGLINGSVEIALVFELDGEIPVKLLEYKGGSRYTRSVQQSSAIEPILSSTIVNALKHFNSWIEREAGTNEKLARKIELNFREVKTSSTGDTVFYSAGRKLTWSDFKSAPDRGSRFAAEIFPFFSFEQSSRIVDGIIYLDIIPKIYVVKSFSWVKDHARNSFTLNHEQRHFDIVKIAAERFRKKMTEEKLTVENYQGIFSVEYLQALREMNAMQEEYDGDTKHGTDVISQERWNNRIDSEIKRYLTFSSDPAQRL